MKFGRLVNKGMVNIGDEIHMIAIDLLFKKMNIPEKDIIKIELQEIPCYDGEYVIVPMQYRFNYVFGHNSMFPPSPKIIPVFIGFSTSSDSYATCSEVLKRFEPIGCRDEYTMQLLRHHGVQCYLSGCLSLIFPRRETTDKQKTFLIDVPQECMQYIPKHLLDNCEYISHSISMNYLTDSEKINFTHDHAKNLLSRYSEEASLIVTSKVHAAAPSIAMGIPTIFTINNKHSALSWIDKILPIYDKTSFAEIDWDPKPIDLEFIKEKMIDNAKTQLMSAYDKYSKIYELSNLFETVPPRQFYYADYKPYESIMPIKPYSGFINYDIPQKLEMLTGKKLRNLNLILAGAGDECLLFLKDLLKLSHHCKNIVLLDKDSNKHGKSLMSMPIYSYEYLENKDLDNIAILIFGKYHDEIAIYLQVKYKLIESVHFWRACRIFATNTDLMSRFLYILDSNSKF